MPHHSRHLIRVYGGKAYLCSKVGEGRIAGMPPRSGASAFTNQARKLAIENRRIAAIQLNQPAQVRNAVEIDAFAAQADVMPLDMHDGRSHRNPGCRCKLKVQLALLTWLASPSIACFEQRTPQRDIEKLGVNMAVMGDQTHRGVKHGAPEISPLNRFCHAIPPSPDRPWN